MKKKGKLLAGVLVFLLLSTTVYAAYGSVRALSSGSSKARQTSSGIYNDVTHRGDAKEILTDANKIKSIYVRNVSLVNGKVHGDKSKTGSLQTHIIVSGSYSRKIDSQKRASTETLARATYKDNTVSEDISRNYISILGWTEARMKDNIDEIYDIWDDNDQSKDEIEQYVFEERNELKEEELRILQNKNIDTLGINDSAKNKGIFHINAAYINDYPEYRTLYIDYMDEHIGIGDYVPSGIYIDKDLNKAYFVSVSDNQVYKYDLK